MVVAAVPKAVGLEAPPNAEVVAGVEVDEPNADVAGLAPKAEAPNADPPVAAAVPPDPKGDPPVVALPPDPNADPPVEAAAPDPKPDCPKVPPTVVVAGFWPKAD